MPFRRLFQILFIAFFVVGCGELSHASIFSDGFAVYVGDRPIRVISIPTSTNLKSTGNHAITHQQARRPSFNKVNLTGVDTVTLKDVHGEITAEIE